MLIIIFMLRLSWLMTSSCNTLKHEHKRQQTRKKLANFRLIFLSNLHVNLWCSLGGVFVALRVFFFFLYIKLIQLEKSKC